MTQQESATSDEHRFIEDEQVKTYFAGLGDLLLAGSAIYTLLVFVVAAKLPSTWTWAVSLTLLYVTSAARFITLRQFRREPQSRRPAQWARLETVGAAFAGLIWGCGSVAMLPSLPTDLQLFVLTVISVVAASAIAASVSLLPPPSAFFVAAIVPPLLWTLAMPDRLHVTLGAMLLIFMVLMLRLGRKHSRAFVEQQRLRFQNVFLAEELARQRDAAEQAHRSKSRFLAAASHDLRQPMHALGILLELLGAEKALSAGGRSQLQRAQKAAESMNGLLDTLLDISKLDAGVVEPRRETCAVAAVFGELESEFQPLAAAKGLRLDVVPCSARIDSDPALLGQILRNLLTNALRYTPSGRIVLGCRRRPGHVDFLVCDSGIGIAADQHEAIFGEFYQVGNKQRDRREGLGLGLAIVSRVARMLDHPLALRSTPGRGTCFSVRVPLAPSGRVAADAAAPAATTPTDDGTALAGRLVLFIDDEEDIRESMRMLLESWRCAAIVAESLAAALAAVAAAPRDIDAVISDMALQGPGDGIKAIAELRRLFGAGLPALLVTGDTGDLALQAARRAQLTMLHKPISPEQLRRALIAAMGKS